MRSSRFAWLMAIATGAAAACSTSQATSGGDADSGVTGDASAEGVGWAQVFDALPGALISVWGTSENDVWAVGSDTHDGRGPLVLRFDGTRWERPRAEAKGDLWWVHGVPGGPVYLGGSGPAVLRYDEGRFEPMKTPVHGGTVFGVWASSPSDVWAVGGDTDKGTGAFIWHSAGNAFVAAPTLPVDPKKVAAFFKVWGTGPNDVWIVGDAGLVLHFDGSAFVQVPTNIPDPLFTVHVAYQHGPFAIVGGADLGVLLQPTGPSTLGAATLPDGARQLFGVWLTEAGGYAVGDDATVLTRSPTAVWSRETTGLHTDKALHSVWVDPIGDVWAVGGDVLVPPLGAGVMVHKGRRIPGSYVLEDGGLPSFGGAGGAGGSSGRGGSSGKGGTGGSGGRGAGGSSGNGAGGSGASGGSSGSGGNGGSSGATDASFGGAGGSLRDGSVDATPEAAPVREAAPPPFDAGTLPGMVHCGADTCALPAQQCCVDRLTGAPAGCIAATDTCDPVGNSQAPVTCDESADCPPAEFCCLNRFFQSGSLSDISCDTSCGGPVACLSAGGCSLAGGACTTFAPIPVFYICQ